MQFKEGTLPIQITRRSTLPEPTKPTHKKNDHRLIGAIMYNLLANYTPLQLPMFRQAVMPSLQSHQVDQTPTRSLQGNDEGGLASTTTQIADEINKQTKM